MIMTMKKIFTLLFCVVAMALTASAGTDDGIIEQCINVVLGKDAPAKLTSPNLDVNNDGKIDVADVSRLIDMKLGKTAPVRTLIPAQKIDVDKLIHESLQTTTGEPNISDVNRAIDHNLSIEQQ